MPPQLAERRLLLLGAVLVLVAMIGGLAIGQFPKVELLLSAHVAATIWGALMIALSSAVHRLALTDGARGWFVYTLAAAGYLNWVATLLGAVLGTKGLTPVHGAGNAGVAAEALVGGLLVVMVICTFVSLGLLVRAALASPDAGRP